MRDVAEILLPWAIVTLALFAFFDWDESRLTPEQLERAWPSATRTLAIVYFGALGVPVLVHFWRTRRTGLGVLLGLVAAVSVFGLNLAATVGVDVLPDDAVSPVTLLIGVVFVASLVWLARSAKRRTDP
jgi:hypothetical protein